MRTQLCLLLTLLVSPASLASLVQSGKMDIPIPANFDGVYLDLDGGAVGFTPVTGWDINLFFGGSELAFSDSFSPVRSGSGSFDSILNLAPGSLIGPSSTYSTPDFAFGGSEFHLGPGVGQFQSGGLGYLGFQFKTNADAGPLYGWMEVRFTPNTPGGVIQSWTYEDTGAPAAVPEPTVYASLMGLFALAVAFRRRRGKSLATF